MTLSRTPPRRGVSKLVPKNGRLLQRSQRPDGGRGRVVATPVFSGGRYIAFGLWSSFEQPGENSASDRTEGR